MNAGGDRLHAAARNCRVLGVAGAVILGVKVNARRIRRPVQIDGIAVVLATDLTHFAAGEWDRIKVRHRVRTLRFRVTGEGHGFAIGRNRRPAHAAGGVRFDPGYRVKPTFLPWGKPPGRLQEPGVATSSRIAPDAISATSSCE